MRKGILSSAEKEEEGEKEERNVPNGPSVRHDGCQATKDVPLAVAVEVAREGTTQRGVLVAVEAEQSEVSVFILDIRNRERRKRTR